MEDAYERFNSYDFEADEQFQSGLVLVDSSGGLDIKLFYYNKFIEPIDPAGYRRWRGGGGGQRETGCDEDGGEEDHQTETLSEPEPGGEGEDPGEPKVLSFTEVMRLVQAGEPVPGLVDGTHLDIAPSNQNPTPSQMERVLKPWETH